MHYLVIGLPPQAVKKWEAPTASQFVSQHRGTCPHARRHWRWVKDGLPCPVVGVWSRASPQKNFEILAANTAFWHTFSQKTGSCKNAKCHTFPFQAVLHPPSMGNTKKYKIRQLASFQDYDGMQNRGARKRNIPAQNGIGGNPNL